MFFYDFLYYKIYKFYAKKEKGASSSAAATIGGLQAMNVLTLIIICLNFSHKKIHFNKIVALVIILFFQITTYVRYVYRDNNSIQAIEEKWLNKSESYWTMHNIFGIVYIILSVILFFGLAIYFGSASNITS
jgi:hypothetical protein